MTINKSKAVYLILLIGCMSLALADMRYNERKKLVYNVQPPHEHEMLIAEGHEIINQNHIEDEKIDSFYSMLMPCD